MELSHRSLWEHNLGLVSGAPVKPVWCRPYVPLFLWDQVSGGGVPAGASPISPGGD